MADSREHGSETLVYRKKVFTYEANCCQYCALYSLLVCGPTEITLLYAGRTHTLSGNYIDTCLFVHYHNHVCGKAQSPLNSVKCSCV